jgi:hypothetical protein
MGRLNSTSTVGNQGYNNLSKLSHSNRLNNKSGKSCAEQNYLKLFHQSICGLKSKINELLSSLYPNLPHIICISEHHLRHAEVNNIVMECGNLPHSARSQVKDWLPGYQAVTQQ